VPDSKHPESLFLFGVKEVEVSSGPEQEDTFTFSQI
jgi:hypothetical protein